MTLKLLKILNEYNYNHFPFNHWFICGATMDAHSENVFTQSTKYQTKIFLYTFQFVQVGAVFPEEESHSHSVSSS